MKNPSFTIQKRGYRGGFRLPGKKTKMVTLRGPKMAWDLFHLNADKTKQYLKRGWQIKTMKDIDRIYI